MTTPLDAFIVYLHSNMSPQVRDSVMAIFMLLKRNVITASECETFVNRAIQQDPVASHLFSTYCADLVDVQYLLTVEETQILSY